MRVPGNQERIAPMLLEGSCHCRAVRFSLDSHTPCPYARCYCSICRKTAGSGGFGIFILGLAKTLVIDTRDNITDFRARLADGSLSPAKRSFCKRCGSPLWLFDPRWPEHLHPFASAIDTPLPKPPAHVDYFLDSAAPWVVLHEGDAIERQPGPYTVGMEDWHKQRRLWVE
jgi:hypothetical protein